MATIGGNLELIIEMIRHVPQEMSLARMGESVILLAIIWSRLKPHLKKIEDRLEGLEKALQVGFSTGETRFIKIEARITALEQIPKG